MRAVDAAKNRSNRRVWLKKRSFWTAAIAGWWVNRGRSREAAARHVYVANFHPLWAEAMERWNSAYYCAKCDGVFVPGQSQFIPAGQARQTIFALEVFHA